MPSCHYQKECWNQMLFSVLGGKHDSRLNFQPLVHDKKNILGVFLSFKSVKACLNSNCSTYH